MTEREYTLVDAEVVEPLGRDAAERLDERMRLLVGAINDSMAKLYEIVEEAKRGNIHATLGFSSWTAYLADVFTVQIRLEPGQRRELVGYLSGEGVSNRVIADMTGVSRETVRRDLGDTFVPPGPVTGRDGKTYRPKPTKPEPEVMPLEEAQEVTERIRDWIDAQPDREAAVSAVRAIGHGAEADDVAAYLASKRGGEV
jgi:transposase